jgi:lipopolysaccharide biosynthesis glycosyltransferase
VHVLLATDDTFTLPTAVAISSARHHTPEARFVVADLGLSDEGRAIITRADPCATFVRVTESMLAPYATDRFPAGMFARLLLDELVPAESDRVVYLDADVLVRRSLADLVASDLAGCIIGAVPAWGASIDGNPPSVGLDESRDGSYAESAPARFGIPPAVLLFNSGVMVVDRERWRAERVAVRLAEVAASVRRADQGLLNLVLWDRWMPLDVRWNGKGRAAWVEHFAGARKPWLPGYYMNESRLNYAAAARRIGIDLPTPRVQVAARKVARRIFR